MALSSEKVLVALPSYNEKDNIVQLIESILAKVSQAHVCVVDDSSPDGTSALVREAIQKKQWQERVHLITRSKKDGRGGAVRDGFKWGVESALGFKAYVEMDCDFSHEPEGILTGLKLLTEGADVVIGARYPNGTIIGWPLSRRIFSFFANTLARFAINWGIADYTNGFRFYSERAIALLMQHQQKHKGYIYLSESLSQLLRGGMRVHSFPIVFKNRERGVSNTSFKEIRNALGAILQIAWEHRRS